MMFPILRCRSNTWDRWEKTCGWSKIWFSQIFSELNVCMSVLCLWSILDHKILIFTPSKLQLCNMYVSFPGRPILYQLNPTKIFGKLPGGFPEFSKKFLGNFPDTHPTPSSHPTPMHTYLIPPPTPTPDLKHHFSMTFFKPHFSIFNLDSSRTFSPISFRYVPRGYVYKTRSYPSRI